MCEMRLGKDARVWESEVNLVSSMNRMSMLKKSSASRAPSCHPFLAPTLTEATLSDECCFLIVLLGLYRLSPEGDVAGAEVDVDGELALDGDDDEVDIDDGDEFGDVDGFDIDDGDDFGVYGDIEALVGELVIAFPSRSRFLIGDRCWWRWLH